MFVPPAASVLTAPPPASAPLPASEPVIHNRPLPDFDRDNPLETSRPIGTVESICDRSSRSRTSSLSTTPTRRPRTGPERCPTSPDPNPSPRPTAPDPNQRPAPEPAPAAASAPAVLPLGNEILPSSSSGRGGSVGGLFADRRRLLFAVLALVVVLAACRLAARGWVGNPARPARTAPVPAASSRTQSTLLLELKGNLAVAVDSALLAHDSANHDGAVVLVPSNVQTQVPGFGSMPFGQALSVGDPSAPTARCPT